MEELEDLLFVDMETASAVMYAAAARFCNEYLTGDAREVDLHVHRSIGILGGDLVRAAARYEEVQSRWEDQLPEDDGSE